MGIQQILNRITRRSRKDKNGVKYDTELDRCRRILTPVNSICLANKTCKQDTSSKGITRKVDPTQLIILNHERLSDSASDDIFVHTDMPQRDGQHPGLVVQGNDCLATEEIVPDEVPISEPMELADKSTSQPLDSELNEWSGDGSLSHPASASCPSIHTPLQKNNSMPVPTTHSHQYSRSDMHLSLEKSDSMPSPTLSLLHRSPWQRKERYRVRFNDDPQIHLVYSGETYDRSPAVSEGMATHHTALELYRELMRFKLTEMLIHEQSINSISTHLKKFPKSRHRILVRELENILTEGAQAV